MSSNEIVQKGVFTQKTMQKSVGRNAVFSAVTKIISSWYYGTRDRTPIIVSSLIKALQGESKLEENLIM